MNETVFVLKPYNYYLLYIGIAAVFVCLVILLKHVLQLFKQIQKMQPDLERISDKAALLSEKIETLPKKNNNTDENIITAGKVFQLYTLYRAVKKYYLFTNEKGFKQMGKSTYTVLQKRSLEKNIRSKVKDII